MLIVWISGLRVRLTLCVLCIRVLQMIRVDVWPEYLKSDGPLVPPDKGKETMISSSTWPLDNSSHKAESINKVMLGALNVRKPKWKHSALEFKGNNSELGLTHPLDKRAAGITLEVSGDCKKARSYGALRASNNFAGIFDDMGISGLLCNTERIGEVSAMEGAALTRILDIVTVDCYSQYLGLPSFVDFGGEEIKIAGAGIGILARVMKNLYYRNYDSLQAKDKSNSSLIWKSFLWGRTILEKGLRWQVSDSRDICVYHDRWIPRPSTFRVLSAKNLLDQAIISNMRSNSSCWDVSLICNNFLVEDANVIMSIPICETLYLEFCYDRIPSFAYLFNRRFEVEACCRRCGHRQEFTLHAVWNCPKLNDVILGCSFIHGCSLHGPALVFVFPFLLLFDYTLSTGSIKGTKFVRWIPFIEGFVKINSDAFVDSVGNRIDLGVVIRDHIGKVLLLVVKCLDFLISPMIVEAIAITIALEKGFTSSIFETDASTVVKLIH
ncbi:hypothetical protein JRO89_XS10G0178500 [Xanthoceras sorbifolium]|uniref:RNase H type-1 domain-containing protein n=1 Tax=Xanthoceras sorbifolium TaxID=99658 RepID=A0ABQ8HJC2_9ROSI|nr:hypothetical protein JRO89_XS10G0178500 [Xanthoceras sorbifolium]